MSLRIRRARPADFPAVMRLLESDRSLLPDVLWQTLPKLLIQLMQSDLVMLCVIEETEPLEVRFLGATAFLNPALRDCITGHPTESALSMALRLQIRHGSAFLNRRQVADANRRGELILLNFFGTIGGLLESGVALHEAALKSTTAWTFFHSGYGFAEVLAESSDPLQAELLATARMRIVRRRPGHDGRPTWLFRVTREDALRAPAAWPFFAMVPAAPRFNFTRQQQEILEWALLDFSDRDIMQELALTDESIKKRWRSIYRTAGRVEPALAGDKVGGDLRRDLLQRLRYNLCELRPYRRSGRLPPAGESVAG